LIHVSPSGDIMSNLFARLRTRRAMRWTYA
jgi:hypothetical protein